MYIHLVRNSGGDHEEYIDIRTGRRVRVCGIKAYQIVKQQRKPRRNKARLFF